jgi:deoxyribodipyrimidine photo-lyase
VHVRKVHWRCGADWLYGHLLDGDLASNHLSWQWVAGTGSSKPYLFNADNVLRYAPAPWHSPGTVIDRSYEALDRMARQPKPQRDAGTGPVGEPTPEPQLMPGPPAALGCVQPQAASVADRDVWLVHPWNLGALPATLDADTVVIGLFVADFHASWPWTAQRWRFVGSRMAEIATERWHGDAVAIGQALKAARSVRSIAEPHLDAWQPAWASCQAAPALFGRVDRRCDSFSQWWSRASRGHDTAADLLAINQEPAW